jgi:PST family polysaccharide transporter
LDKILALRGGGELVALWAQLSSVIELVAGVALAGLGAGLSVLVAQAPPQRRHALLHEALRLGLGVALPVGVALAVLAWLYVAQMPAALVALACLAGWMAVIAGMVNSYWLGCEQRGRMLALAAGTAALALAAGAAAPPPVLLAAVAAAHAAPALVLVVMWRSLQGAKLAAHPGLRRYVLPGLAIGILSPVSLLAVRALVADALSWHDVGVLQALWRTSDWICGLAGGVLSVFYLPKFAAARPDELRTVVRGAFITVVVPSGALLAALFMAHQPLLGALYEPSFVAPDSAVALLFAGSLARIASWVPLVALYAMRRTRAIAIGELLSLPLFAALVALRGPQLTLEVAGGLWLLSFLAYCAFNLWAMRRI